MGGVPNGRPHPPRILPPTGVAHRPIGLSPTSAPSRAQQGRAIAGPERPGYVRFWPKCEVPTGSRNVCCGGRPDISPTSRIRRV